MNTERELFNLSIHLKRFDLLTSKTISIIISLIRNDKSKARSKIIEVSSQQIEHPCDQILEFPVTLFRDSSRCNYQSKPAKFVVSRIMHNGAIEKIGECEFDMATLPITDSPIELARFRFDGVLKNRACLLALIKWYRIQSKTDIHKNNPINIPISLPFSQSPGITHDTINHNYNNSNMNNMNTMNTMMSITGDPRPNFQSQSQSQSQSQLQLQYPSQFDAHYTNINTYHHHHHHNNNDDVAPHVTHPIYPKDLKNRYDIEYTDDIAIENEENDKAESDIDIDIDDLSNDPNKLTPRRALSNNSKKEDNLQVNSRSHSPLDSHSHSHSYSHSHSHSYSKKQQQQQQQQQKHDNTKQNDNIFDVSTVAVFNNFGHDNEMMPISEIIHFDDDGNDSKNEYYRNEKSNHNGNHNSREMISSTMTKAGVFQKRENSVFLEKFENKSTLQKKSFYNNGVSQQRSTNEANDCNLSQICDTNLFPGIDLAVSQIIYQTPRNAESNTTKSNRSSINYSNSFIHLGNKTTGSPAVNNNNKPDHHNNQLKQAIEVYHPQELVNNTTRLAINTNSTINTNNNTSSLYNNIMITKQAELEEISRKIEHMRETHVFLKLDISDLETEKSSLRECIESLRKQLHDHHEFERLQTEYDKTQNHLRELQNEFDLIQNHKVELTNLMTKLEEKNQDLIKKIEILEANSNSNTKSENQTPTTHVTQLIPDINNQVENKIQDTAAIHSKPSSILIMNKTKEDTQKALESTSATDTNITTSTIDEKNDSNNNNNNNDNGHVNHNTDITSPFLTNTSGEKSIGIQSSHVVTSAPSSSSSAIYASMNTMNQKIFELEQEIKQVNSNSLSQMNSFMTTIELMVREKNELKQSYLEQFEQVRYYKAKLEETINQNTINLSSPQHKEHVLHIQSITEKLNQQHQLNEELHTMIDFTINTLQKLHMGQSSDSASLINTIKFRFDEIREKFGCAKSNISTDIDSMSLILGTEINEKFNRIRKDLKQKNALLEGFGDTIFNLSSRQIQLSQFIMVLHEEIDGYKNQIKSTENNYILSRSQIELLSTDNRNLKYRMGLIFNLLNSLNNKELDHQLEEILLQNIDDEKEIPLSNDKLNDHDENGAHSHPHHHHSHQVTMATNLEKEQSKPLAITNEEHRGGGGEEEKNKEEYYASQKSIAHTDSIRNPPNTNEMTKKTTHLKTSSTHSEQPIIMTKQNTIHESNNKTNTGHTKDVNSNTPKNKNKNIDSNDLVAPLNSDRSHHQINQKHDSRNNEKTDKFLESQSHSERATLPSTSQVLVPSQILSTTENNNVKRSNTHSMTGYPRHHQQDEQKPQQREYQHRDKSPQPSSSSGHGRIYSDQYDSRPYNPYTNQQQQQFPSQSQPLPYQQQQQQQQIPLPPYQKQYPENQPHNYNNMSDKYYHSQRSENRAQSQTYDPRQMTNSHPYLYEQPMYYDQPQFTSNMDPRSVPMQHHQHHHHNSNPYYPATYSNFERLPNYHNNNNSSSHSNNNNGPPLPSLENAYNSTSIQEYTPTQRSQISKK